MTDTPPNSPSTDPAEIDPTRIDSEPADDDAFSNEHPLASPNELAGDAASGIELEFAARDLADAQGAAAGIDYEEDTLPLDGN